MEILMDFKLRPYNHHNMLHPLPQNRRTKPPPLLPQPVTKGKPKLKVTKKYPEQKAFPNSIPIHRKNPHAVYKDIQRLADQNKLQEALTILDYLERRGVPVNSTTFSSLIACCVRLKSLKEARIIHTHIRLNGLQNNEFLQTKLVNMYVACGSMEDARTLFDEMPKQSVYTWNALLRGNVVLGSRNYRQALKTLLDMRVSGLELNAYSFSCLIKSLAGACALYQGLKVHGILVKNGLIEDNVVKTSLIDMYFKCGKVKLARCVFEELEERDVVVWGTMIAGFAHNRLHKEALQYLRWMIREGVEVNSVILTSVLPVVGEVWAHKLGQELHAYVIKTKEYAKQLFIQTALVDMYCKCGDMVSGRIVFYGSMERNAISWTALLSGYISNGRLDQALRSIIWMQQEGFKPDVVTIATVLPVCGHLRALKQGKEIHGYIVKNGFLPNISVATSLLMMYSKCGVLRYSLRVFHGMQNKNVISWTAMMDSYVECKCLNEAVDIFREMQLSKHRPDSVAVARMLSVCSNLKALKLGKELHGQILKKDIASVPFVSAEIVKMYGNCGEIDKAEAAFDAIYVKGSLTWTAIIEAYESNSRYEDAIKLFREMISRGFSPNHFTFKVVLRCCVRGGFPDEACQFFTLMSRRYKLKASDEHYSSIISVLTRVGRIDDAERFIRFRSSAESRRQRNI